MLEYFYNTFNYYYDYINDINDINKLKNENLKLKDKIKDLEQRLNNVIISKNEIYEKYINLIIKK